MTSISSQIRAWTVPAPLFLLLFAATALPHDVHAQSIQWTRQFGTSAEDQATAVAIGSSGI